MISLNKLKVDSNIDFVIKKDAYFNQLGMATSSFEKNGVLSFLSDLEFANDILDNVSITAFITTFEICEKINEDLNKYGIILSNQPKKLFYKIHNYLSTTEFYWKKFKNEFGLNSKININAIISEDSVKIGNNVLIEENVTINSGVIIGDNVIIRSGTIIGGNSFQFLNDEQEVFSVNTAGKVLIGNNVEIQHLSCIDKGVFGGNTVISDFSKIDNLVHISHDCYIGERTLITAGVKIGGRTIIGNDSFIGLNSTIANGLAIGNKVTISMGSVVTTDILSNKAVINNFSIDHERYSHFLKSLKSKK